MQQFASVIILPTIICGIAQGLNVGIDLSTPIAKVEPEFISVTIDCLMLIPPKWKTFNFRYKGCAFHL